MFSISDPVTMRSEAVVHAGRKQWSDHEYPHRALSAEELERPARNPFGTSKTSKEVKHGNFKTIGKYDVSG